MTELLPIDILPAADDLEHGVLSPPAFILQRRNADVKNRKDEIVAPERRLAREERFEFELAMVAADRGRRDNGNEKDRLGDCRGYLIFPQRAVGDGRSVLPQPKIGLCAAEL